MRLLLFQQSFGSLGVNSPKRIEKCALANLGEGFFSDFPVGVRYQPFVGVQQRDPCSRRGSQVQAGRPDKRRR